jgi:hypothetical protein
MTRFSDELLMRRADGELSPAESQAIDQAAEADPQLAERLRLMRASREQALSAFPLEAAPGDGALVALIARSARQESTPSSRVSRPGLKWPALLRRRGFLVGWGSGAAMALAAGLMAVAFLPSSTGLLDSAGQLDGAALTRVLDTRLAAEGPDGDGFAVGLTYRDHDGDWCRTFSAAEAGYAGLACREGSAWRLEALARSEVQSGQLRTAASAIPEAVLAAVDATAAGDPLDGEAEARARDAGWTDN